MTTDEADRDHSSVGVDPVEEDLPDLEEGAEPVEWLRPDLALLTHPVVLRAVVGIVVACLIVLWPDVTDRILTRIVGFGLVAWALSDVVALIRSVRASGRRSVKELGVSLTLDGLGLAVGGYLLLTGGRSGDTLGRLVGLLILGLAVKELLGLLGRSGTERFWLVTKGVAMTMAGLLVVAFPKETFSIVTVLFAFGWAALGLITVAMSLDPSREGVATYSDANALMWQWLETRPKDADNRQALYDKILYEGSTLRRRVIRFVTLMSFASVIASMGVITDSTAVVIGAMLIAPLMTPLMGMAISLVMGWPTRLSRSAMIAAGGIGLAILIGVILGAVAPTIIDTAANGQITARSSPTTLDLIVALAAGAAGAYGLSRPDVSDALPGVAIAISLVPPLSVVGIAYSQGDWGSGNGALLLFATNMLAILVMGGVTFVLTGVTPLSRVTENQHRVKTWVATVAALGMVVLGALLLNGSQITNDALRAGAVERSVEQWLDDYQRYEVVSATLAGDTVTAVIIGPTAGRPPAGELAAILRDELGRPMVADVRLVVQEREIAESE